MDEVERILVDTWNDIETLSCTVEIKSEVTKGLKQLIEGTGTYDYRNKDGKIQVRLRLLNALQVERGPDDVVVTGQKILKIFDGDYFYELQEMHAGGVAQKSWARPGSIQCIGGERLLNQIHQYDDVRFRADETLGKEKWYVYRTSKDGGKVRAVYYIHQSRGLLHKLVLEDDNRGAKSTIIFNKFLLNEPIPDDRFAFKVPEGVEIIDSTQPASADNPAPATP